MGETLDFTGKILIDSDQNVNLIINVYKAVTWYSMEELIFLTCYRPYTETYIIFLYPHDHRIELARDYLPEEDYRRVAELLCRERNTLIKSARERGQ